MQTSTLLTIISSIFAAAVQAGFLDNVVRLPECARRCASSLPPGCTGNPTCVCKDDIWMNSAQCCVQSSCGPAEVLITQQFASQLCALVNSPPKAPRNCPVSATPAFSVKLPAPNTYGAIGEYNYKGCYKGDAQHNQVLWGPTWLDMGRMTQEACWNWCNIQKLPSMALVKGEKCFCSDGKIESKSFKQPDDRLCQWKCDGKKSQLCGGDNMFAVWQKANAPQ